MLEFLGVDQLADRKYYIAREKFQRSKKETQTKSPDRDIDDLFDDIDEDPGQNEEILPTNTAPIG